MEKIVYYPSYLQCWGHDQYGQNDQNGGKVPMCQHSAQSMKVLAHLLKKLFNRHTFFPFTTIGFSCWSGGCGFFGFFGGLAWCWGGWADVDDYAGRAFVQGGFGLVGGLVFFVIQAGQIICN